MGQKVLLTVPWLPVLIWTVKIWTVVNWTVITNPNPNLNTNSKPNTNPNPKSNHNKNPNPNGSPNPVLTVQISQGNFTVQILTVQISCGYPFILPMFCSQFVTNNIKFDPTLYWHWPVYEPCTGRAGRTGRLIYTWPYYTPSKGPSNCPKC